MHELTKVGEHDNPSSPCLTPGAAYMLQHAHLLALGTLDEQGRPWATLWGGRPPFAQRVAESTIGISTIVDRICDPVAQILFHGNDQGEVMHEESPGRMVAGLSLNLEDRKRVKLFGRMVAGALKKVPPINEEPPSSTAGHAQLVVKVEQSLGNCPKYINCKRITTTTPQASILSEQLPLSQSATDLITKADLMFIASSHANQDMDVNIRGGPRGFVRIQKNHGTGVDLVWPEYSGNNLYQTLGNLQTDPKAGLVFPNFETGDVLYLTGITKVLVGQAADEVLPHSRLAVKMTVQAVQLVENGLSVRGSFLDDSPYIPKVWYLAGEGPIHYGKVVENTSTMAKLIKKEALTPTIHRYRFGISDPVQAGSWKPGQYVALSFQEELDMGYSHMRDDDPQSLNDDYLRTFTVSSRPGQGSHGNEFEITVRKAGNVTRYLSMQTERSGIEVPLQGFGGEFRVQQLSSLQTAFVAGGIGITPLLAQLEDLDMSRLRLLWSLNFADIGLVQDTFARHPDLPSQTSLFLTGNEGDIPKDDLENWQAVHNSGASIQQRRITPDDLRAVDIEAWYMCTGSALRKQILGWLPNEQIEYENFDY